MSEFKIAAAQVPSIRGDLQGNMKRHLDVVSIAAKNAVSVLLFPELSLLGYEPELAKEFELDSADALLGPIALLAHQNRMHVVAGAAIKSGSDKPYLGAFVFGADGSIRVYAKMHLGEFERSLFTAGNQRMTIASHGELIGLSICADSSKRSHPAAYSSQGVTVYSASVFLNAEWYASDSPRYPAYAADFKMLVVMANHAASIGTFTSVGNSAIWAHDGSMIACAPGTQTALVSAKRNRETWLGEVVPLTP